MDPAVTDSVKEQRLLAAIVFTDVVGFSKLAAKNEARVYVSLQRDMGIMTDLCRAHGGQVLNTMGDGMMMSFPSAVDAMTCAVEIQRTLAAQAHSLPPSDVLHHRIGVHLGDIIVKGDNVFGDGVNTAARLQNAARPDSIWFSDTVAKVVKNKLKFDCKNIGPRMFKNLGEPVNVWEVPPIVEVQAQLAADAAGLGSPVIQPESDGIQGGKAFILILASLIMVGAVVFMVIRMGANEPKSKDSPSATVREEREKQLSESTSGTAASTTGGEGETATVSPEALRAQIEQARERYDFATIVQVLSTSGATIPELAPALDRYRSLSDLRYWLDGEIAAASPADPIQATLAAGEAQIHGTSGGAQIQFNRSGFYSFDLSSLSPGDVLALIRAIEVRPNSTKPAELNTWTSLFSQEYSL